LHDPSACRANGESQSHLLLPSGGACDQQVRQVGASNQQGERDDADQQQHKSLDRLGVVSAQRSGPHRRQRQSFHRVPGRRRVELTVERFDCRRGLLTSDPVTHSANDVQPHEVPGLEQAGIVEEAATDRRRGGERHVEARRRAERDAAKTFLRHADDGDGLFVDAQQPANHGGVSAESRAPVLVTEHRNERAMADVVRGQQEATGRRTDAEDVERVARHEHR
jgi:hypothetical protein